MKKWVELDSATTPDGQKVTYCERDGERSIRVGGVELMNTRERASEEALGRLACTHLMNRPHARVLIGGLGLGFTLKAVLATLRPDAQVDVVELLPAVVKWNALPDNPRVKIIVSDVVDVIAQSPGLYDSILLDVDNGPAALTSCSNGRLYRASGLTRLANALRPGGCAAVWSANEDPHFTRAMTVAGFTTTTHRVRAHTTSGGMRAIFLGFRNETAKARSSNDF